MKVVVANQRKEDTTWRTTVNREYAEMFARGRHEAPSCTTTTALMTARLSTACRTRHDVGLHTNSHSDGVHSPHRRRHTDRSIAFASWRQCGRHVKQGSLGSLESAAMGISIISAAFARLIGVSHAHRHRHRPRYSACSSRPHLFDLSVRCGLIIRQSATASHKGATLLLPDTSPNVS